MQQIIIPLINTPCEMSSQSSISTAQTIINPETESFHCRICLDQGKTLMKLCECSGSIAYVHEACIIEWIETRIVCDDNMVAESIPTPMCEICKTYYSANIKIDREEISRELFWQNVKKLTTFNTLFTLVIIAIYMMVLVLMVHWVWDSYHMLTEHNEDKENICLATDSQRLDIYTIAKYALVWGLFPLHYLYSSVTHLRKMKRFLIDGSKQIIADVTLIPKEVLKTKCEERLE